VDPRRRDRAVLLHRRNQPSAGGRGRRSARDEGSRADCRDRSNPRRRGPRHRLRPQLTPRRTPP